MANTVRQRVLTDGHLLFRARVSGPIMERTDEYAAKHGLSRSAAIGVLLEAGLRRMGEYEGDGEQVA